MASFPEVIPDYNFTEITVYNTVKTNMWGAETRHSKWGPRKGFTLTFNHATTGEMNYIRDFFIARKGDYEKFDWTHPLTSVVYSVRFSRPNISVKEVGVDSFNIETEFIEVL